MNLPTLIRAQHDEILVDALERLLRVPAPRYHRDALPEREARLRRLLELVVQCTEEHTLVPMVAHAEDVARARYAAGYPFREVHAAFNVLEEALWRCAFADAPPQELGAVLSQVGTVLGAGKEALAAEYVTLASRRHAPSLDLPHLFSGAAGVEGAD